MTIPVIVFRVGLAVLCGGLIGLERHGKNRPAGFRTYILVSLGSACVMILSEQMFRGYYQEFGAVFDPQRMGAQVISGIGFLGAGTILRMGPNVKGLTTAASLWAVSAVGLAAGAGQYSLAIIASVVIYLTLVVFNMWIHYLDKRDSYHVFDLTIQLVNKPKAIGHVNMVLAENDAHILDMDISRPLEPEGGSITVSATIKLARGSSISELMNEMAGIPGVIDVMRI